MRLRLRLQEVVQEGGPMTGFCYAYARLLRNKLVQLGVDNQIFKGDLGAAIKRDEENSESTELTRIAEMVICHLTIQVFSIDDRSATCWSSPSELKKFLVVVDEFLAIFEVPETGTGPQPVHPQRDGTGTAKMGMEVPERDPTRPRCD